MADELHPISWRIEEITRMVRLASDLIEEQQTELRRMEHQLENFQRGYFNAVATMRERKEVLARTQRWLQHTTTCPGYGQPLWDVLTCHCGLEDHLTEIRRHL